MVPFVLGMLTEMYCTESAYLAPFGQGKLLSVHKILQDLKEKMHFYG